MNIVSMQYCSTEFMIADALTKQLNRVRFERLRQAMGVLRTSDEPDKKGC